jgi:hypothetical protein
VSILLFESTSLQIFNSKLAAFLIHDLRISFFSRIDINLVFYAIPPLISSLLKVLDGLTFDQVFFTVIRGKIAHLASSFTMQIPLNVVSEK